MKNKVLDSFDEAVADVPDGASVVFQCWGLAGTPQNLILALHEKGCKELTVITHNFLPIPFSDQGSVSPTILVPQMRKLICPYARVGTSSGRISPVREAIISGQLEVEVMSHGTLVERLRAGAGNLGGFYTPVGVGTVVEEGKERRLIDGKEYIFEKPLRPDFALVRAYKADRYGNLVYRKSARSCNPIMAMAAKVTIVEVDEIVEVGEIDPDDVVTPHVFVDRIVKIPEGGISSQQQRVELLNKHLSVMRRRLAAETTRPDTGS